MMKELKASNNTIIIDRTLAKQLNLKLYDEVGIDFNSAPRKLRIIGFFGPEPTDNSANNGVLTSGHWRLQLHFNPINALFRVLLVCASRPLQHEPVKRYLHGRIFPNTISN